MSDPVPTTTQELEVPIPALLRRTAADISLITGRLRNIVRRVPAGVTHEALQGVLIRLVAQGEVLEEKAKDMENWPKEVRNAVR